MRVRGWPGARFRWIAGFAAAALLGVALYASTFVVSYGDLFRTDDPRLAVDVARLAPARIERVERPATVEQLQSVLREARQSGLRVSVAGSRHSQGGQTYAAG